MFVEALRDQEQMRIANERFADRVPMLANMVEGGKSPLMNATSLQKLGFALVIFPGATVRSLAFALQNYFRHLHTQGGTADFSTQMLDFKGINQLLGTDELLNLGQQYDAERYR